MKKFISFVVLFAIFTVPFAAFGQKGSNAEIKQLQSPQNPVIGFMIHGGSGVIKKGEMTPEKERAYRAQLEEALLAGYKRKCRIKKTQKMRDPLKFGATDRLKRNIGKRKYEK